MSRASLTSRLLWQSPGTGRSCLICRRARPESSRFAGLSTTAFAIPSTMLTVLRTGKTSTTLFLALTPLDRTSCMQMLMAISVIRPRARSRFAPLAMGAFPQTEAPWRTDRIYRVLGSGKKFSASDMLALQTDVYSELDRFVADKLVYAIDHAKTPSAQARKAADILREWNGQMSADSAAPTIVSKTRLELKHLLLEPKLGPAPESNEIIRSSLNWKSYTWQMQTVWLENTLTRQPPQWLPPAYSNYNELLAAAVDTALKQAPADLSSWKWGPQNSVTIQNPVLGKIPILRRWTGPGEQAQSGSGYTVKASGRDYGSSERFTADLSNLDASTLNLVTGESGNFLSPYYMDQWQAWYTGYTFTLPFSSSAARDSATHRMILQPK